MEDDDGSNAAEFWAERTAILSECMDGADAQHYATVLTKRWCRKHGFTEPKETRWRLFSTRITGDEPTEPGASAPDIVPNKGWWRD
ncbi:hypothetical protein [Caballeronia sordidicola]|uniref:hypothetical protein n=1 Tax=Caballeronia sordidicola TaxID=196367 RepID=UPI0012FE2489|nr:hypothetical protein [Caballeronia sordidicola]